LRNLLLSSIAFTVLAGSAVAADLPSTKSAPVFTPAPVFSWTGVYVGVYGGGAFGEGKSTVVNFGLKTSASPNGGTAGGLVGYNYQFSPNFVIGLEGEGGWQGLESSTTIFGVTTKSSTDYVARIRGRLGYAMGNALIFVAGGASFSDLKLSVSSPGANSYAITKDSVGWTIGGGVDYAFTPNWIARVEYLYDEVPSTTYGFLATSGLTYDDVRVKSSESTVRAAIIYKFGLPEAAPVVAKY